MQEQENWSRELRKLMFTYISESRIYILFEIYCLV